MQKSIKLKPGQPDWEDFRYFLEVARTERLSEAARRMGVDYTTVSRRIRALEAALGTLLFDKSRATGFTLTAEGVQLLTYAETIETTVDRAVEEVGGIGQAPSGHVRVGTTEGFGIFFLTPLMMPFKQCYPQIEVDLLPVPRLVSLSKREVDVAITIERPDRGPYLSTKLCDYHLRLYGTEAYFRDRPPIRSLLDLKRHQFVSYVDELVYSEELLYLERYVENPLVVLRSTSVVAQHVAVREGMGLGILPCFIGGKDPTLVPVLPDDLVVRRSFWLSCHEDLRKLRRIDVFWDYLRQSTENARDLMLGD